MQNTTAHTNQTAHPKGWASQPQQKKNTMNNTQIKTLSLSPITDAETANDEIICERNYLPEGWVPSSVAKKMEIQLRVLLDLIEVHEVTCFSCDRDGELYCDCLQRQVKVAKDTLAELELG
jgi:hypothetical protein